MATATRHLHHAQLPHRKRRGYVGSTNLCALQRECGDGHGSQTRTSPLPKPELRRPERKKFVLPLLQSHHYNERSPSQSQFPEPDWNRRPNDLKHPEEALSEHIARAQRNAKTFKDESWYKSPIGFGSRESVVHAALKQLDTRSVGFVSCRDVVRVLQRSDFGLKEHEARALLAAFDPSIRDDDSAINYAVFAHRIRFPPLSCGCGDADDHIFRHHSYLEKIRDHAQQLVQKSHELRASTLDRADVTSESRVGLDRTTALSPGSSNSVAASTLSSVEKPRKSINQIAPRTLKCDNHDDRASPSHTRSIPPQKSAPDIDRLSFEFDKHRREARASAKASTLLAHIHRLETVVKHEQQAREQQENLRLAAHAVHRLEHIAHALQEEQRNARVAATQGKGLVRSDRTRPLRSVSKDSMFYTCASESERLR